MHCRGTTGKTIRERARTPERAGTREEGGGSRLCSLSRQRFITPELPIELLGWDRQTSAVLGLIAAGRPGELLHPSY
jgi:hypothetical protein